MSTEIPSNLKYTKEHEWLDPKRSEDGYRIGITAHAVSELGDIAFVELPDIGTKLESGARFSDIESTKTVSELFAPVNGKVSAVNRVLEDAPEKVNDSPYLEGWILAIEADEESFAALMNAEEYAQYLASIAD